METELFFGVFGLAADIIGVAGAVIALKVSNFQKREKERLSQKIKIRLVCKDEGERFQSFIDIPGKMLREDLSRSEVLGWIGMLPMIETKKRERYTIKSLSSQEFHTRMNEIKVGKGDMTFEIICEKDELEQFDVVPQVSEQVITPSA